MLNKIRSAALTAGVIFHLCVVSISSASDTATYQAVSEDLITSAQPTTEDLESLKEAGVTRIINLRMPSEKISFNEKSEAEKLGIEYVSLPISGAADITSENARKLHEILKDEEKTYIHCATGNRVGALLAIRAHELEGRSIEESLEIGHAAGLSSLEPRVKSILTNEKSSID
jgi:uncharacterized protein (TIGR01244 family)